MASTVRASEVRILRKHEVLKLTGLGKTWIDVLERRGEFPKRRQLSGRACGWLLAEVEDWIRSRPHVEDEPKVRASRRQ